MLGVNIPESGVYPRACGGTPGRVLGTIVGLAAGSIPARAGEPRTRCPSPVFRVFGVYPRACGGTAARIYANRVYPRRAGEPQTSVDPSRQGLSPRVRGNLKCV